MNIICFRPMPMANLNDTFIEWGIKLLLKETLGNPVKFYDVYFEPLADIKIPDHDLFVVCGTPWIWDQCTLSGKYRDLIKAISSSNAPKIALGLGACFPFGFECNTIQQINRSMPNLKNTLENFSAITVRDTYAKTICDLLEINSDLLCCPALFAGEYIGIKPFKPKRDILFLYAPQFGLSSGILSSDFIKHYTQLQVNYARKYNAKVICITPNEAKVAEESGLETELLHSPQEIAQSIATAGTLLSGRVHGCMFAAGLSIPSALLPVDTRFLTYQYLGGKVIMTNEVSSINIRDLHRCKFIYLMQKWKWKRFLKSCLRSTGLY